MLKELASTAQAAVDVVLGAEEPVSAERVVGGTLPLNNLSEN